MVAQENRTQGTFAVVAALEQAESRLQSTGAFLSFVLPLPYLTDVSLIPVTGNH